MATMFVEVTRPAYPEKGLRINVHKEGNFSRDVLSPDMTCVFKVEHVSKKEDALGVIIEKLAGHTTSVYPVFGERSTPFRGQIFMWKKGKEEFLIPAMNQVEATKMFREYITSHGQDPIEWGTPFILGKHGGVFSRLADC